MRLPVIQFWCASRDLCRGVRCCALAAIVCTLAATFIPHSASAQILAGLLNPSPQATVPTSPPHPSVCRVVVEEKGGMSYGSGTLIDIRENVGLVITNWHVVVDSSGPVTVIFPNGFQSPAQVLLTDKDWDLAALAIWKPDVQPVAISPAPPIVGEPLAIAGYGSGAWRLAVGKCTQYVAPSENLPYEMVEVSAEARQGDSGGPIFNARGELAGVLFGASRGTTSGSFSGRVKHFLRPILDGAGEGPAAEEDVAAKPRARIPIEPANDDSPVPKFNSVGLPTKEPVTTPVDPPPMTPVYNSDVEPHVSQQIPAEPKNGWDDPTPDVATKPQPVVPLVDATRTNLAPPPAAPPVVVNDVVPLRPNAADTRMASVAPTTMHSVNRLDAADEGLVYTPLPPRPGTAATLPTSNLFPNLPALGGGSTPPVATSNEPWKQLLQQFAGKTPFDQGKTILAALGILTVLYRFVSREQPEESSPD